ncbi:12499_t:CDS:2, partial [Funneliformis caledonium]
VKTYAKQQGFQVRLGKIEKNAIGQICKRTIVCNREDFPDKNLNEHNHSIVSGIFCKFMSEERTIPIEVQERILLLRRAGCNVPTIRAILKEEFSDIVTWIYDDLYNFIYQKEGIRQEFDSNDFVKKLEHLKSQDNEFYYEVLIDLETNEFRQAIWMFPEQRMNYYHFYDIVIFDNTYKTNRFEMPFGIFTGVNNYGQSMYFVRVIMSDKTAESFIWTFTNFLKMVNNTSPKVFLTDEDQAIIKVVDLIFQPHRTKHALCLWHLMKNVVKNLNGILGFK